MGVAVDQAYVISSLLLFSLGSWGLHCLVSEREQA